MLGCCAKVEHVLNNGVRVRKGTVSLTFGEVPEVLNEVDVGNRNAESIFL